MTALAFRRRVGRLASLVTLLAVSVMSSGCGGGDAAPIPTHYEGDPAAYRKAQEEYAQQVKSEGAAKRALMRNGVQPSRP